MKNSIILIIFLTFIFSGCESDKKIIKSGKTIKIGILAPLSGESISLGHQSLVGIQASNKMKKYLKNGDEIVFEVVDTKSDINSTKLAFEQLVNSDVRAIFSFMGSTEMVALKNSFNKAKIPIIATLATNTNITTKDGYISQVCIDNRTQVIVASHYIKDEILIDNSGVVYNKKSEYSHTLAEEFVKNYTFLGGKIDFYLDISDEQELAEYKNLNTKNTKILFNTTNAKLTEKFLKIKNNGLEILGSDGLYSSALELNNVSLFNGIYTIEHYAHDIDKSDNQIELEKLLNKDNLAHSSFSFLAYDGYQLLINSLEYCPSYEKECLNNRFKNSDVINGVSGNFSTVDAKVKREVYIDKIDDSILKKEIIIY